MNDLRAQLAEIWRDLKAWASTHPVIAMLCALCVALALFAVLK